MPDRQPKPEFMERICKRFGLSLIASDMNEYFFTPHELALALEDEHAAAFVAGQASVAKMAGDGSIRRVESSATAVEELVRAADGGPWRVGRRVGRNIYFNDHPVCMVESDELAAEMVLVLNAGQKVVAPFRKSSQAQGDGK